MNPKDRIISWLRDAYAMERGLEMTLKIQAESDRHDPDVRNAAATHMVETQQHAAEVERLLKSLGAEISPLKTGAGILLEATRNIGSSFADDGPVKDLLACYASEHFEIGCYTALAAAGKEAQLPDVVRTCQKILVQEKRMAKILSAALPRVIKEYLDEPVD